MIRGLKPLARDLYSQLLYRLRLSHPSRTSADSLLILTFHRVLPAELRAKYPLPGLAVTPQELRWILEGLLPHFDNLPVSQAVRRHRERARSRPLLAVSFDDGQWDNLEFAVPVLENLGVPATFYLPTDFIGQPDLLWHDHAAFAWRAAKAAGSFRQLPDPAGLATAEASRSAPEFLEWLKELAPEERSRLVAILADGTGSEAPSWARMMDWIEARRLADLGHEIGSHGRSHALLPQLDAQGQWSELNDSRQAIAGFIGSSTTSFCYPNGSFDAQTPRLAEKAGYQNAVTTRWGINDGNANPYLLYRCDMDASRLVDRSGALSTARLAMRVSGKQPGLGS